MPLNHPNFARPMSHNIKEPHTQTSLKIDHDAERVLTNSSQDQRGNADSNAATPPASRDLPVPYSVFTTSQKWAIVVLATFAGIFSPLAASIYFPAIPTLATAFHKSTQSIKFVIQHLSNHKPHSSIIATTSVSL